MSVRQILPRSGASATRPGAGCAGLGILLVLELINRASVSRFDRLTEQALLASVPRPPSACRAFAYYNDGSRPHAALLVDAMRISQNFDSRRSTVTPAERPQAGPQSCLGVRLYGSCQTMGARQRFGWAALLLRRANENVELY